MYPAGVLDRSALSTKIFGDKVALQTLNDLVHPKASREAAGNFAKNLAWSRHFVALIGAVIVSIGVWPVSAIATGGSGRIASVIPRYHPAPVPAPASASPLWLECIVAFGPYVGLIAAALGAVYLIRRGRLDARNTFAAEILKFRLKQIEEFYAPASLDIEQSRIVYKKLLWLLERNSAVVLSKFRLLDHIHPLMHDPKYAQYKPLVKKILEIGSRLTTLISENTGLIEGGITKTFVQYQAHFDILNAASELELTTDEREGAHEFGYYPRMLNVEINEGYKTVSHHLKSYIQAGDGIIANLLKNNGKRKPDDTARHRALMIETLHYYEEHSDEYADAFDGFDLSAFRRRLIAEIGTKRSGERPLKILDAGSGTGRDLLAFVNDACVVTGIDASPAMIRACNRKIRMVRESACARDVREAAASSECIEMAFDDLRFRNEFDGVWAAASLLHVPKAQFPEIIQRLIQSLKTDGICYVSLKYGRGEGERDGRFFAYHDRREIRRVLKEIANAEVVDVWLSNPNGQKMKWSEEAWAWTLAAFGHHNRKLWLNVLVRRVSSP